MIKIKKLQGLEISFEILKEVEKLTSQHESSEEFQCTTFQSEVLGLEGFYITAQDYRDRAVIVHGQFDQSDSPNRYVVTLGKTSDFEVFTKAPEGTCYSFAFKTVQEAAKKALDWLSGEALNLVT